MLSRSVLRRGALRCQFAQPVQKRYLAEAASGSFQYQTGDASGVKIASRDLAGPTTTLALVAKAGTRYQLLPGLTEGLEKFAFRGTERRSALRIVRESELLGAELESYHSRENLVIGAKFLRDDLPYFVELLAEVASSTKYLPHVYTEEVLPLIQLAHKKFLASPKAIALSSAHSLAFHRGLGTPVSPASSTPYTKYLAADTIEYFSQFAYAKPNFAIVANGAEHADLSKWVNEFFGGVSAKAPEDLLQSVRDKQSKYYGGEERIAHGSGNSLVLAFPGSSSFTGGFYKPEIQVLASLLGGKSNIKWSSGFSLLSKAAASPGTSVETKSAIYSDAGLLYINVNGTAENVSATAIEAVKTLHSIAGGKIAAEDIKKAKAAAKFQELETGQDISAGLELTGSGLIHGSKAYQLDETAKAIDGVTDAQVKAAAKTLLESKASVSAVGDLFLLPYAEDLGLKV
ncbi:LuxS/MPP-like metallohydrolase [Mytilinidion resinicola]|uniref:Cytochrome b-c1 complex subunit 2, mitochondrial n=1 Tax=Mytilinidion resinicola TaxID=574789 RepID=A0A6A6YTT0_9PEZI|nr:LuxS/MPP-like metallohydrolase [Mytilinidion resinicola]KAF2811929.1 LuxS/MPP-like metallohydrolase [Mytilinidion resinicola]